ncbi:(2Fe-2S)-binding protein [candidate division CSSED10-310 bacterium]|uniref:(2Fe-2S)-binding protein n=1 Tax=candidate division CSSED10-310 bacterium TaxID=2855610 RepID=A0ABV6YSZ3_UNCC1
MDPEIIGIRSISFTLNDRKVTVPVQKSMFLIDLLRHTLGLTGTKEGCGEGECGACTVIVDGLAVNSCLYPALEVEGKQVITVEGLQDQNSNLSRIQQAFVDKGAIQCGFCSPGMIMSVKALLDASPDPSEAEIREALLGNLCRCTGYVQIIEAVQQAALQLKDSS